jgi:hypothetical protein
MVERDVIISALACGGKMSCRKQAAEFAEPPVVININSSTGVPTEGATVQGFKQVAKTLKTNKSVLEVLLATQAKNIQPRRVCLVSHLEGWGFIHEVLKTDDYKRIDTIICLEGPNARSVDNWKRYYQKTKGRLWLAHTKKASCENSVIEICRFLPTTNNCRKTIKVPDYISKPIFDKSISIYSKGETPKTKIYHQDTLCFTETTLRVVNLGYEGQSTQDQMYIQQYVQPRLWRWLREIWANDEGVIF